MIITPEHFKYLHIQRGEVSHAYRRGFDAWKAAYETSLDALFDSIVPVLPADPRVMLDVGGGLGGIGVLLHRQYPDINYWVLDGVDDPPVVRRHSKTFSNSTVAADFLHANGVEKCGFFAPQDAINRRFDLVVSFAAWCFHFPPSHYLEAISKALMPGATVILDFRKGKDSWYEELCDAFGSAPSILETGKKHVRLAWTTLEYPR